MAEEHRLITEDLSDIDTTELMMSLPNYFDFTHDIEHTAYLNWRFAINPDVEARFFNMGEGYFETSISLIEQCIADNRSKRADIWIFPILFNIVHGIEVYLKGFNSLYPIFCTLEKTGEIEDSKIQGKHDIRQLCQVSIKLIRDSKNKEILDEMLFVQKFIEILYENTDDMTFARYPVTSKKENHFYVDAEHNVTIDLNVLRQWVLRLFKVLDTVTGFIYYQTEQLKEWRADTLGYWE